MFTKALIAAFALIGAQAIKLETSTKIDSTNSSFSATDMDFDDLFTQTDIDYDDLLAQIETERWGGDGMEVNSDEWIDDFYDPSSMEMLKRIDWQKKILALSQLHLSKLDATSCFKAC